MSADIPGTLWATLIAEYAAKSAMRNSNLCTPQLKGMTVSGSLHDTVCFATLWGKAAPVMNSRILLAADHEVVRLGLRATLAPLTTVTVCGETRDGIDAIRKAHLLKPDIVIVDTEIPRANAVIITQRILEQHPEQKVLVLADNEPESVIRNLLRAGIRGLVSKADPASSVLEAVNAIQRNRTYFTAEVDNHILDAYLHPSNSRIKAQDNGVLTLREQEVLQLLAEGLGTKQTAVLLGISVKTVETHRSNIMRELGIHAIAELVLYAVSHHLVEVPILRFQEAVEIETRTIHRAQSVRELQLGFQLTTPSFAVAAVATSAR